MTDSLDELMELQPTHASALLLDPVELAQRTGGSARTARRRANWVVAGISAIALALVAGLGTVFVQPMQAMVAGPSPRPSGFPSAGMEIQGGVDPAPYSTQRVGVAVIVGGRTPDQLCLGDYAAGQCSAGVELAGVTWAMVPWRETEGTSSYARAEVFGTFDGTTFTATKVEQTLTVAWPPLVAAPKRLKTSSLRITCEVTVNPDAKGGLGNEPLSFPGLEAYWADPDLNSYVVAISGDLGVAVTAVKKAVTGPACIGTLPPTGALADLVAAITTLNAAKVDGVVSAELSVDTGGAAIRVQVAANVPGLREKVTAVVGTTLPVVIDPVLLTVA
jgi:hypothetical protein